jgi:hypothetical protein
MIAVSTGGRNPKASASGVSNDGLGGSVSSLSLKSSITGMCMLCKLLATFGTIGRTARIQSHGVPLLPEPGLQRPRAHFTHSFKIDEILLLIKTNVQPPTAGEDMDGDGALLASHKPGKIRPTKADFS